MTTPPKSADDIAWGRLTSFARKVSKELGDQKRPCDVRLATDSSVKGWIFFKTCMSWQTRRWKDGYQSSWRTTADWDQVWLSTSGDIYRELFTWEHIVSGVSMTQNGRTNDYTRVESSGRISREAARAISGHPPYRSKEYRDGKVEVAEARRLPHRAMRGAPYLGMSKMLSDLRSGNTSRSVYHDYD